MAGWPTEPQALTDLSYIAVVSCQNHPRMISLALPLLLLSWLLIHFIHRFYTPANKSRGILPTSLTNRRQISTTITLRTLYLRIESTAFNFHHDALSHRLTRNPTARLSTALRVAFDLGIVISLLGMVVALALLSWTFMLLVRRLVVGMAPPSPDIHTHVKRTHQSDYIPHTSPARAPADIPVQLLVRANHTGAFMPPNVSYPLTHDTNADPRSHFPALTSSDAHRRTILLSSHTRSRARSLCRTVRRLTSRAGPLLMVSSSDGVPLQSLGASLTFVLPAAFVAFPSHAVAALSPHVRARIAAAGPLLSALLGLAFMLPLGRLFLLPGYSDISTEGLMVASVAPDSPLASHLPLGVLLTALDDLPLANAKESAWREYLTTPRPPDFKEPAWCVDTKWFLSGRPCHGPVVFYANGLCRIGHPQGCCAAPPPGSGSEACLVPLADEETPRCTNAPELLVPTTSAVTRCEGVCTKGQMCVRLRGGEEFLRISAQSDNHKNPARVVLWRGSRDEIYQGGTIYLACGVSVMC